MVQPLSTAQRMTGTTARPSRLASAIVSGAAMLALGLAVGAVALWAHYGTAVFFEMIKSGIAACI